MPFSKKERKLELWEELNVLKGIDVLAFKNQPNASYEFLYFSIAGPTIKSVASTFHFDSVTAKPIPATS
jgi:hypothetical protein